MAGASGRRLAGRSCAASGAGRLPDTLRHRGSVSGAGPKRDHLAAVPAPTAADVATTPPGCLGDREAFAQRVTYGIAALLSVELAYA